MTTGTNGNYCRPSIAGFHGPRVYHSWLTPMFNYIPTDPSVYTGFYLDWFLLFNYSVKCLIYCHHSGFPIIQNAKPRLFRPRDPMTELTNGSLQYTVFHLHEVSTVLSLPAKLAEHPKSPSVIPAVTVINQISANFNRTAPSLRD